MTSKDMIISSNDSFKLYFTKVPVYYKLGKNKQTKLGPSSQIV